MMTLLALRLVHVLTGIFWVGTVVFVAIFLFPALRAAGNAAAGPVMAGLIKRRLMVVLPIVALLTVASGLWLVWLASAGNIGAYARTPSGRVFTSAGGLAIIAFVIGVTVSRPAGVESGRLAARMATTGDPVERESIGTRIAILQRRNNFASWIIATLLVLAAAGMATARYL